MIIEAEIKKLVTYAVSKGLITPEDRIYSTNRLLEILYINDYTETEENFENVNLRETLDHITNWAISKHLTLGETQTERDLFDTKLMGVFMDRPSNIIQKFKSLYLHDKKSATDWFYKLNTDANYIRTDRISQNKSWSSHTCYGDLNLMIHHDKEKDLRDFPVHFLLKENIYPKCPLCRENEGYAGRLSNPAGQNRRSIPLQINGHPENFLYVSDPLVPEHFLLINKYHKKAVIDEETFKDLLDFVRFLPHYFIGTDLDSTVQSFQYKEHSYYEGGLASLPIMKSDLLEEVVLKNSDGIQAGLLSWPAATLMLQGTCRETLAALASKIVNCYREYNDPYAYIFSETGTEKHNTVATFATYQKDTYKIYLIFKNNIRTDLHKNGLFAPHRELQHLIKGDLNLLGLMGSLLLKGKLQGDFSKMLDYLEKGELPLKDESMHAHLPFFTELYHKYPDLTAQSAPEILKYEVGLSYLKALEQSSVFKLDENGIEDFEKFLKSSHLIS